MSSTAIRPFRIAVPQPDLDDLNARLARARWTRQLPGQGWERGVPVDYLRELAAHWWTEFDWRANEAALDDYPQFLTEIDGLHVHFLHVRSSEPDALPLVLTHGWPNSFVEFTKTIPLLTNPHSHAMESAQAFHVVISSVPGFGYSAAPREMGMRPRTVALMWAVTVDSLGPPARNRSRWACTPGVHRSCAAAPTATIRSRTGPRAVRATTSWPWTYPGRTRPISKPSSARSADLNI
ncbi:epoxide hydrolase family protein [Nocardia aurantiaca]|uniref:epoxide hydrolase family protein n=1 Tax=Nocardia aurantiaca TaxID=2675850 RepID=UPI001E3E32FA|nr:epoxide hydrolase [Nocardia aurantiaca]